MDYTQSERSWVWLSSANGMTARKFYKLLASAGDAQSILETPGEFRHLMDDKLYRELVASKDAGGADALFDEMEAEKICAVTRMSDRYPSRLMHISDPPATLYIKGNTELDLEKPFAVVGTRRASYDGRKTTGEFVRTLTENGVCVISGLARGIDTFAHSACLEAGGRTVAVLGNGLKNVYPPENKALARRILDSGGSLISEFRLEQEPTRWTFPARNRIIAGLSDGVLVVEGDRKSGSLITAQYSLEEGRDVFAIPGSIYNYLAEGPNSLIQSGAYMALSPWDILETLRWGTRPGAKQTQNKTPELDESEKKIYDLLKTGALSFDEIENGTGLETAELNSYLTMLTLRSIIIKLPGNLYRLS